MAPPGADSYAPRPPCATLHKELKKIKNVVDEQMEQVTPDDAADALVGFVGNAARLYSKLKALLMLTEEGRNF